MEQKDSQTYAWIFLSVPDEPGSLQDIIAMADGINHAIPLHGELQKSFGWPQAHGFIRKEGKRYGKTEAGVELITRCSSKTTMNTWKLVEQHFESLMGKSAALDDITPEEIDSAYRAYKKAFWKQFKELEKKRPEET